MVQKAQLVISSSVSVELWHLVQALFLQIRFFPA